MAQPSLGKDVCSTPLACHPVHPDVFIVTDHAARYPDFVRDVSGWLREGEITYRETVVEGIERAPDAFIGLLQGKNLGKMVVKF